MSIGSVQNQIGTGIVKRDSTQLTDKFTSSPNTNNKKLAFAPVIIGGVIVSEQIIAAISVAVVAFIKINESYIKKLMSDAGLAISQSDLVKYLTGQKKIDTSTMPLIKKLVDNMPAPLAGMIKQYILQTMIDKPADEPNKTPPQPTSAAATGGAMPPEDPKQKKAREESEKEQNREYRELKKSTEKQLTSLGKDLRILESRLGPGVPQGSPRRLEIEKQILETETKMEGLRTRLESHPARERVETKRTETNKKLRDSGLEQSRSSQEYNAKRYETFKDKIDKIADLWTQFGKIKNDVSGKQVEMKDMLKNEHNWTNADRTKYNELSRELRSLQGQMRDTSTEARGLQRELDKLSH